MKTSKSLQNMMRAMCLIGAIGLAACGGGGGGGGGGGTPSGGAAAPEAPPVVIKAWSSAALIETNNVGDADFPQVAVDADGNALAVWSQSDGMRTNIWANRYTPSTGWGTATLIESNNTGAANNPDIAMDANGNAIAVWEQNSAFFISSIWANRYTKGVGWGAPELIETSETGIAESPKIAFYANGNAIAVWTQIDGGFRNVNANRYTVGVGWGTAVKVETSASGNSFTPKIAIATDGTAIAVWQKSDGTRDNIWASRFAPLLGWTTPELIETGANDAGSPRIAIDANGNALAVWQQTDGTQTNIWANRYTAGSGWGTAALIETDNAADASSPQIAIAANGNATAVWYQSDGTRRNIVANRYTAGSGWGTAAAIEADTGDAVSPQIALDASGNALAVWEQFDGTRSNTWSNRYTPGSGWGTAALIELDNTGGAFRSQIAVNGSGNAVAVWGQSDGTRINIVANTFR